MGEKSFTFFEIHLHDPSFNAPESGPRFFGTGSDEEDESEDDGEYSSIEVGDGDETEESRDGESVDVEDAESEESGRSLGKLFAGVAVLGLAAAVKYLLGEDADELDELDDLSDIEVGGGTETEDGSEETDVEVSDDAGEAADSGRGLGGSAVVGFVLLAALAIAVKVLTGGDDDLEELDDLSDVADEADDLSDGESDDGQSAALDDE